MTLTELLVAIAILTIIAGALAGAFSIGYRVLGSTGAQAKYVGDNDLMALEQQIGADVSRASCLKSPQVTSPSVIPTGGCTKTVGASPTTCVSNALLCLAWYASGSTTCHTVSYVQPVSGGDVVRYDAATGAATTAYRISTGGLNVAASWSPRVTSDGANGGSAAYQWTKQVTVTATPQGVGAPPATVFYLNPLSADPLSPTESSSIPC